MPTLEEYRRWLSGEDVEGFPKHDRAKAVEKASSLNLRKVDAKRRQNKKFLRGVKYDIIDEDDAILRFGKFNGQRLSYLVTTPDGYSYMEWMTTQDFPDELNEIVEQLLEGKHKPGRLIDIL